MQKAGKGECPLCRSQVVLTADRSESCSHGPNWVKIDKDRLARSRGHEVSLVQECSELGLSGPSSQWFRLACGTLIDTSIRFMKEWFPKEVKVKRKENEIEVAKEQVEESGLDTRCIIG